MLVLLLELFYIILVLLADLISLLSHSLTRLLILYNTNNTQYYTHIRKNTHYKYAYSEAWGWHFNMSGLFYFVPDIQLFIYWRENNFYEKFFQNNMQTNIETIEDSVQNDYTLILRLQYLHFKPMFYSVTYVRCVYFLFLLFFYMRDALLLTCSTASVSCALSLRRPSICCTLSASGWLPLFCNCNTNTTRCSHT